MQNWEMWKTVNVLVDLASFLISRKSVSLTAAEGISDGQPRT
jgi:hypothetical protein